jgi:hypothetical protein
MVVFVMVILRLMVKAKCQQLSEDNISFMKMLLIGYRTILVN